MNRSTTITLLHNEHSRILASLSFLQPTPNIQPRFPKSSNQKSEFSAPAQPHTNPQPQVHSYPAKNIKIVRNMSVLIYKLILNEWYYNI